jgi:hypothetical protein
MGLTSHLEYHQAIQSILCCAYNHHILVISTQVIKVTVPLRPPFSPLANGATPLANSVNILNGATPLTNFPKVATPFTNCPVHQYVSSFALQQQIRESY